MKRALLSLIALAAAPALAQAPSDAEVEATLSGVVRVQSRILADARTAASLGLRREGSGVLVREGYVLTIGYLVVEAESIEVTASDGKSAPATLAAYDHQTGVGLLRLVAPLAGRPMPFGDSRALEERDAAMVVGAGGAEAVHLVQVASRRPFAGSWEYLLEAPIVTYPPVPNWSGAALLNAKGELLGVGSLVLPDAGADDARVPGNLFVPIEVVAPILEDLVARGRAARPARPWLGLNLQELHGRLIVGRLSPEGPAELAGVRPGDLLVAVEGERVGSLAEFYRRLWARGAAGADVTLRVQREGEARELTVRSIDRLEHLRRPRAY
ncbi:MAG: S1C family serine protease [Burkholderiales bacterium]